jgi:hypothetical protein
MPWRPSQVCAEPECHELVAGSRCAQYARVSTRNHRGVPRQQHDQRFDVLDRTPSDGDGSAELADMSLEEDYPRSAWDPHAGEDDPGAERPLAEADAGGAT